MPDRDPTPREEAALRRLLRDARHDGPVPPEVAARTEETLASLAARGPAASRPAARGGPDHHRRRRAATAMLVAAVSIVVVGLGIGQVVRPAADQESSTAASDTAGSTARDTPPDRAGADEQGAQSTRTEAGPAQADRLDRASRSPRGRLAVERLALVEDPPAVRETRFARDVRRVRELQQVERAKRSAYTVEDGTGPAARDPAPGFTCARVDVGAGRPVAVRYEDAPAVLVLRPATRATQVADLVECRSGDVLRSVTLPR